MKRVLIAMATMTDKNSLSVPLTMLCQLTRLVVVAWFIWDFAYTAIFWSDKNEVLRAYSEVAGHALEPISGFQQAAGYSATLMITLTEAVFVVKVWQLFGYYIAGHIFDRQAVSAFRAMAGAAMALYIVSLVMRPIAFAIVSNGGFTLLFWPSDVRHGAMVLLLVILAKIFSVGAAIAEEHSQIV